jgi:hypothetical protein
MARKRARGKMDPDFPGLEWFDRGMVRVRWERWFPRLVVHEKHEQRIKWTLRGLAVIGISLSVVTISPWYNSLGVAVGLLLLSQFFERAIFEYTAIHIAPVPDFRVRHEDIGGMGYAIPVNPDSKAPIAIGPAFTSRGIAEKFFRLMRAWNDGASEDVDNNVCLTFVREDPESYTVILHANLERQRVKDTFELIAEASRADKPGKELQQLVMHWVFFKRFNKIGLAGLQLFTERCPQGRPYFLGPFLFKAGRSPEPLRDIRPLIKRHYRVCDRKDLKKKDIQYWAGGED